MKAANLLIKLVVFGLVACFGYIGYQEITKRLPDSDSTELDSPRPSDSKQQAPNGPSWSPQSEKQAQRDERRRERAERAAIAAQEREDRARGMLEEREARLRDEEHEAAMENMREGQRQRRARFDEQSDRPSSPSDGMSLDVAENPFNLDNPDPMPAAPEDPSLSPAERRVERLRQSASDCAFAQRYPNKYKTYNCEGVEERLKKAEEALRR
jgi:hypothetical protein